MSERQKTRVQAWLTVICILAVMDFMTYLVSPRDAWNPLHPHPANWVDPKTVYGP